jgi:hypothetical protein
VLHLIGAGYCPIEGVPAVYLVGRCEGRLVSIFMLPGDSLDHFPHTRSHLGRAGNLHGCRMGANEMVCLRTTGNVIVAVGQVRSDRLVSLLEGYRHEEHHAGNWISIPVQSSSSTPLLTSLPRAIH